MSPTSTYSLPFIPAAIVLGTLVFLLFVPVFALGAAILIAAGILVALLGATIAAPILILRSARRRWSLHQARQAELATEAGLLADANSSRLREPRTMHLPLNTKGIQ